MQKITVSGIEIEFDDCLDVSIEDGGKRIRVSGFHPDRGVYAVPVIQPIIIPYQSPMCPPTQRHHTWPTYPIVTCGDPLPSGGIATCAMRSGEVN